MQVAAFADFWGYPCIAEVVAREVATCYTLSESAKQQLFLQKQSSQAASTSSSCKARMDGGKQKKLLKSMKASSRYD